MSIQFPSIEFFQALQRLEPETSVEVPDYTFFGLELGDVPFMLELEDGRCASASMGGNPNDLDFILAASADTWRTMFENIAKHGGADGGHTLTALLESGAMELRHMEDEGRERFEDATASLQALFDAAQHLSFEFL